MPRSICFTFPIPHNAGSTKDCSHSRDLYPGVRSAEWNDMSPVLPQVNYLLCLSEACPVLLPSVAFCLCLFARETLRSHLLQNFLQLGFTILYKVSIVIMLEKPRFVVFICLWPILFGERINSHWRQKLNF